MKRVDLEHIIRAAAGISRDDRIVVLGSQSVLGSFPDAPDELLASNEADIYPFSQTDRADLIEGSIGEGSPFHETFGYYAQAVDETTAVLPRGWRERLVTLSNANTGGATGLCLDIHDLLLAKLVAGREKDLSFCIVALRHQLANPKTLRQRLQETELDDARRELVAARIERLSNTPASPR